MNKYREIQQSPRVWRNIIIIIIFIVCDIVVPRFFTISFRTFHENTNRNARRMCKYVFIGGKYSTSIIMLCGYYLRPTSFLFSSFVVLCEEHFKWRFGFIFNCIIWFGLIVYTSLHVYLSHVFFSLYFVNTIICFVFLYVFQYNNNITLNTYINNYELNQV